MPSPDLRLLPRDLGDTDALVEAITTLHTQHMDLRRQAATAKQTRDAGIRALYTAGLTQQKIADVVGILQPEISKIVRGMRAPAAERNQ